jgi:hypothetical protein
MRVSVAAERATQAQWYADEEVPVRIREKFHEIQIVYRYFLFCSDDLCGGTCPITVGVACWH